MRKVVLYGEFGRRFGKYWHLDVRTPAEAIRAICTNRKEATSYLFDCEQKGVRFRVYCGRELSNPERMTYPVSRREVIRIVPVVAGAGDGKAVLTIAVGIALVAFAGPAGAALASGATSATAAVTAASWVSSVGVGLVLSGISSLLVPTPKAVRPEERPENKPSFQFSGVVNTTLQGGCVPVCYGGPIEVGSYVVSASMDSRDIAIDED